MFERLTDRLRDVFRNLAGRGRLTEANISDATHEVRRALLDADVLVATDVASEGMNLQDAGAVVNLVINSGRPSRREW